MVDTGDGVGWNYRAAIGLQYQYGASNDLTTAMFQFSKLNKHPGKHISRMVRKERNAKPYTLGRGQHLREEKKRKHPHPSPVFSFLFRFEPPPGKRE